MNLRNESGSKNGKTSLREAGQFLLLAMAIILLFKFIFILVYIPTGSMEPTIKENSAAIGWRLGWLLSDPVPERGTIIVFDHEEFDNRLVKRVIGLPGDVIRISEGQVYVNGVKLDEPYIAETPNDSCDREFFVPEGKVFVLGDNRNSSNDSRFWNNPFVEIHHIYANVLFRMNFLNPILQYFDSFSLRGISQ